jgi:large subunit ribosomal protein L19
MSEETTNTTLAEVTTKSRGQDTLQIIEPVAIRPGMTIRVHQVLFEKSAKGEEKKRIQVFEGMVLARKHGTEAGATFTVRKVASGVGVEKIFPINSPFIAKIELVKTAKVRRANLGYLRTYKKKLKEKK